VVFDIVTIWLHREQKDLHERIIRNGQDVKHQGNYRRSIAIFASIDAKK
jgi:hypothetical protein